MADLGSQGGIKVVPDDKPIQGGNPGEPSRPQAPSSVNNSEPEAIKLIPGNSQKVH